MLLSVVRRCAAPRAPAASTSCCDLLVIAATNRADSLDPALLRPGRFDRRLAFTLPAKKARRELIDHLLARKAHDTELDDSDLRDQLAQQTLGASPVTLERLLDEALIVALRAGRDGMRWTDVQQARLRTELGLTNPVTYTDRERTVVATHEAGHAVVAHLTGHRRLEVLSIIKRGSALGLLAHGDLDEVFTRTRSERRLPRHLMRSTSATRRVPRRSDDGGIAPEPDCDGTEQGASAPG
jgi:ATP-dependent Zn protease